MGQKENERVNIFVSAWHSSDYLVYKVQVLSTVILTNRKTQNMYLKMKNNI